MAPRRKLGVAAAAGAVAVAIAVALFGDISYRLQDGEAVTITGQRVCLPHKQGLFGGPGTDECAVGFRGEDGRHFVLLDTQPVLEADAELKELFNDSLPPNPPRQFHVSGVFTYGATGGFEKDRYDVVGTIDVRSVVPA